MELTQKSPRGAKIRRAGMAAMLAIGAVAMQGCANMSPTDQRTFGGAAIGGVAGSVLTGGSAAGTLGGAAIGGLIGNTTARQNQRDWNDQQRRDDQARRDRDNWNRDHGYYPH